MTKEKVKANVELGEFIKYHREKKGMSLADLGKKVGVSYIHISYLEKGLRIPSEELLKELAKIFANSKEEEVQIRQKMFFYLAQIKAPAEISDKLSFVQDSNKELLSMPDPFLYILEKSIKNKKDNLKKLEHELYEKIYNVLDRKAILTRTEIIKIAEVLQEDVDVFLLLAGYLPDKDLPTIIISRNEMLANLFEKFKEVFEKGDQKTAKKMMDLMESVLKFMK